MKYLVKFFVVTFLFFVCTHVLAEQKIAYIDMKYILNNSKAGKEAQDFLQKKLKQGQKKFVETENSLKTQTHGPPKSITYPNVWNACPFSIFMFFYMVFEFLYFVPNLRCVDACDSHKCSNATKQFLNGFPHMSGAAAILIGEPVNGFPDLNGRSPQPSGNPKKLQR